MASKRPIDSSSNDGNGKRLDGRSSPPSIRPPTGPRASSSRPPNHLPPASHYRSAESFTGSSSSIRQSSGDSSNLLRAGQLSTNVPNGHASPPDTNNHQSLTTLLKRLFDASRDIAVKDVEASKAKPELDAKQIAYDYDSRNRPAGESSKTRQSKQALARAHMRHKQAKATVEASHAQSTGLFAQLAEIVLSNKPDAAVPEKLDNLVRQREEDQVLIKNLQSEVKRLGQDSKSSWESNMSLQKGLASLRDSMTTSKEDISNKHDTLSSDLDTMKGSTIAALQASIAKIEQRVAKSAWETTDWMGNADHEIQEVTGAQSKLSTLIAGLQQRIGNAWSKVEESQVVDNIRNTLDQQSTQITTLRSELKELREASINVASLNAVSARLKEHEDRLTSTRSDLNSFSAQHKSDNDHPLKQSADTSHKIAALEEQLNEESSKLWQRVETRITNEISDYDSRQTRARPANTDAKRLGDMEARLAQLSNAPEVHTMSILSQYSFNNLEQRVANLQGTMQHLDYRYSQITTAGVVDAMALRFDQHYGFGAYRTRLDRADQTLGQMSQVLSNIRQTVQWIAPFVDQHRQIIQEIPALLVRFQAYEDRAKKMSQSIEGLQTSQAPANSEAFFPSSRPL